MKMGRGEVGERARRRRRIEVTSEMHLVGLQIRWKDLDISRVGVRDSSSSRSLGVVYLKARDSVAS